LDFVDEISPCTFYIDDTMVAVSGVAVGAAAIRRQQLTGKKGVASLTQNKKAFFIAVFAS
jgi:hypothetical protein